MHCKLLAIELLSDATLSYCTHVLYSALNFLFGGYCQVGGILRLLPANLQLLVVFDQKLCKNIKKVLNVIGFMLFRVSLHFIIIFEPVRYRNAKQCICLEFAQRFYENDVFTSSNVIQRFCCRMVCTKKHVEFWAKSIRSYCYNTFLHLLPILLK